MSDNAIMYICTTVGGVASTWAIAWMLVKMYQTKE